MNEIASRYGMSLFSLAKEADEVEVWQKEIKDIKEILLSNKEIIRLFSNEFISLDERIEILHRIFKDVRKEYLSLFEIVMKNHRISILIDILDAFNSEANKYRGVKEGLLYSAIEIDKQTFKELENSISKIEGCPVELKLVMDSTLIGGFKVVINNHIYDSSIQTKLQNMKSKLLKNEG